MVEEKTIYTFDQPLTRYQFSDINLTIVSGYPPMSEDEPTPEPTPTPPEPITYEFISPLTAYGIDPENLTLENSITTTTSQITNSFWLDTTSYICGGIDNEGSDNRKKSNDNFDCSRDNIKILKFGNVIIECGGIYFNQHANLFLPTFTGITTGEESRHTLTFHDTLTWGSNTSWPTNTQIRPIYDKTTDTLYGVKQTSQSLLETELTGHELIYCESTSNTNMNSWHMMLDDNTTYPQISFSDYVNGTRSYYIKMPHASNYITNITALNQ